VIHTFPKGDEVHGVTLLNDDLYVLRQRRMDQVDRHDTHRVEVFSTTDFTTLHYLSVPGLKNECLTDITACEKKHCVYLSDCNNSCIHRLGLDRSVSKWPVSSLPWGLSVTRSCNLVVACCDHGKEGKLLELSGEDGQCVREVALQVDIHAPWRGVQLDNGQYVICHGHIAHNSGLSRVGDDGVVIKSNKAGLKEPRHLAVDSNEFILVADSWNNRIVLFDPSLNYVCNLFPHIQSRPEYLCFDVARRRLYVSQEGGVVFVVQLHNHQSVSYL